MTDKIITIEPETEEVRLLRIQLTQARREQAQLQQALQDVATHDNQPNEFEGSMQIPDNAKVLKTRRRGYSIVEMLLGRIGRMCGIRPVMGNVIGIGVALLALYFIQHEIILHGFAKYQHYLGIGLLIFAGVQIVKSGTRSLLLPLVATIGGAVVSHTLVHHQTLFSYGATFFQYVMIVGIIGLGISVLNID